MLHTRCCMMLLSLVTYLTHYSIFGSVEIIFQMKVLLKSKQNRNKQQHKTRFLRFTLRFTLKTESFSFKRYKHKLYTLCDKRHLTNKLKHFGTEKNKRK